MMFCITDPSFRDRIKAMIKSHEGFRAYPYRCTAGHMTIGYGHNLDVDPASDVLPDDYEINGITSTMADLLLEVDLGRVVRGLRECFPFWDSLSCARQAVLIDMAYNLGLRGLNSFKRMLAALRTGDYDTAAADILNSRYAHQAGNRARDLFVMMRRNVMFSEINQ